jgi:diphosphomevalonate decarboxylase
MNCLAEATMPANIALIKYMGKQDARQNIPANASLSYTLNHLRTKVKIYASQSKEDCWQPLDDGEYQPTTLKAKEIERYLAHLNRIKHALGCDLHFLVQSANNFPKSCGLASSAASFAALSVAAVQAIQVLMPEKQLSQRKIMELSRQGSGSSCRSFLQPWAMWKGEEVTAVDVAYQDLKHVAILSTDAEKTVSSTEAHRNIAHSLLFKHRPQRAELRLESLLEAFKQHDWHRAYIVCWQEFWDMHALFATADPPFHYFNGQTLEHLNALQEFWQRWDDGPLVTMDAGPQIHLLFRSEQTTIMQEILEYFNTRAKVITDV